MRLLLCEDWVKPIYGEVFLRRFRELGVEAYAFKMGPYADPSSYPWNRLWQKAQNKFRVGPAIQRMNTRLISRVRELKPDVVFLYRAGRILPETVRRIREHALVIGLNNDDPFSPRHPKYWWRHLVKALPYHDLYFAYREKNLAEYRQAGCACVDFLRSNYVREWNYPLSEMSDSTYRCDVSFTGHWENDSRDEYVAALLEAADVRFRLFGDDWHRSPVFPTIRKRIPQPTAKYGHDYNLVLNSSKIALVFLSKINNDTYTRRCFEIPATGIFMLSEFTEDQNGLFQEGVEAEYFRSPEEMLDKIRFYLRHEALRAKIARAGRERLLRDGHEALDRVSQIIDRISRLSKEPKACVA